MAGDVRPPGDISVKTRFEPVRYRVYNCNGPLGTAVVNAPNGAWTTIDQMIFRSARPSYAKGAVVLLSGGTSFRKSTAYSHESVQLNRSGPLYECAYRVGDLGGRWQLSGGQDSGREIGAICTPGYRSSVSGIPQDARNEAVTKALNKIADQKVNLGENLATLGQTLRLFSSKSAILSEALEFAFRVKSWKKLLIKSAYDLRRAGPLTTAAQEYLAYVYGLRPLMQDIHTLGQLAVKQGAKTLLFKGVGTAHRMPVVKPRVLGAFSRSRMEVLSGSITQHVKCTVWGQLDPNTSALRSLNQLGLVNPLGLAWDLVPFSFCVDWILPIGPVLYALTAPIGLLFIDGSLSCRTTESQLVSYKLKSGGVDFDYVAKAAPISETKLTFDWVLEDYTRSTLTNWPLPGLWFDTDPFRFDRPLKALALGIIALSGKRASIR